MMTDGILAAQLSGSGIGPNAGIGADSAQRFQEAYNAAADRLDSAASGSGMSSLLNPLLGLNSDSLRLSQTADRAGQIEMKPSELMQFTMRSHEFLFHCELVSNVANRSSDGMQQLFRQQG